MITSTDIEVIKSFTSDPIISIDCGKLADQKEIVKSIDSAQAKFRSLLLRCVVACSIKEHPDEYTISLLWNYVSRDLSTCTFKEIETAVVYNATGRLEKRIEHFQVFDLAFLSQIMDQWFILKSQTRQKIAGLLPKENQIHIESPEQRYQGLLNFINKNQSFPEFWSWNEVYSYMDSEGLIKDSNTEKKVMFTEIETKMRVKMELEMMEIRDFIERDRHQSGHIDRVKAECRKQTIIKNLTYLIT